MSKSATFLPLMALLGGCAVGPDYVAPATPQAERFAAQGAVFSGAAAPAQFWTQFGDPVLDTLVTDALQANHDLRIAAANFAAARALRRQAQLDLAPTVIANGGYTRQQLSESQAGGAVRDQEFYDAGFDALWELDFFGRLRRAQQASHAELEASEARLRDAMVVVSAEVTRSYFELRGQQQQLAVAQRNVANQSESVRITSVRLEAGRGTEFDTARANAQLDATRASIAPLQAAIARSMHRIAVLTGRTPDRLVALLSPGQPVPDIVATIAVGDPAALLRRRPDIRVAERELAAASASIGVAVADLFPRVTFVGGNGYSAGAADDLGTAAARRYRIAPGISWAALDLGRVRARIGAARARNDAALARYEKTVLGALEETENALVSHARSRERVEFLNDSATASQTAAALARLRFENGAVDFLQVLDAERTLLEAQNLLAQSRTETATSLVAVYKALGGGWESGGAAR
jgi:multidrug efflux system outer membrane protein